MKKWLFITFGVICVILGSIGIVTPVLPTTPFLLLAAFLFARSSPKMHKLLLENRIFGKYLLNYFNNKPIPISQKAVSIFFVWLGLGLTFYFANLRHWFTALLVFIGVAVSVHISMLGKYRLKKHKTTFWDVFAPIYDLVQNNMNRKSFFGVVQAVRELTPVDAIVLECAAGTGEISIAIADKAKHILCTDMSEKMLNIAEKKAKKRDIGNISFDKRSIYDIGEADNSFDVVIASQVLHLLDNPELAAAELRRVARKTVIVPVCLLKELRGFTKYSVKIWRLFGFAPKQEFNADCYAQFLKNIGFEDFKMIIIKGRMPMAVAVWEK
jgi:uncharacterized membrane protein YbaN (DUF454 family)/ubiquinone/menaquinone biosynthesis C-methylase UbiE